MIHVFHFSFIDNIRRPNGNKEVMEEDLPEIALSRRRMLKTRAKNLSP